VEDRKPKPGHVFYVSECTNHDGHGDWCQTFRSFREATGFYRRIEEKAAPWCGLYPDKGVREIPEAEATRYRDAYKRHWDEVQAFEDSMLDQIPFEAPDEDDDFDDDLDNDWFDEDSLEEYLDDECFDDAAID
jgi:hypothetical protein